MLSPVAAEGDLAQLPAGQLNGPAVHYDKVIANFSIVTKT